MCHWNQSQKRIQLRYGRIRVDDCQRWVTRVLVGIMVSLTIVACNANVLNWESDRQSEVELTLVSFAVTRQAYTNLIPKFVEKWQREHNQTIRIARSFGASGAQTRAVIDGLDADIVHLALALDTDKLVNAKLVEPGWEREFPNNSIVATSVAALITRPGNPKTINSFADLSREGVQWVTADPKTSGVARWNFLALWNYAAQTGKNEVQLQQFMTQAFENVTVLARDAREAAGTFLNGQGDALINYENEVILAQQKGESVDYIVPDINISIDTPIALVDKNVNKHGTREVAQAFVEFLYTPEAQIEFAKAGFRPVIHTLASEVSDRFPSVKMLGNVSAFGGWNQVQKKFFADGAFFDQMQHQISDQNS